MFSGSPSVSACFRACVRGYVLLAGYLTNQRTEFHLTLVEGKMNLLDFEGRSEEAEVKVTARP